MRRQGQGPSLQGQDLQGQGLTHKDQDKDLNLVLKESLRTRNNDHRMKIHDI